MDRPQITVTVENGHNEPHAQRKTINFQCGLLRETETFIGEDVGLLNRDSLLDYVADMLCIKFPEHPYGDLLDKLVLYRHNKDYTLVPFEPDDPVEDGMIVEVILDVRSKQEYDDTICPHILTVNTYRTPGTFCDYCGAVLFGLLKQGLKCEGCDKNYHKGCAYKIPNNCTRLKETDGVSVPPHPYPRPKEVWSGRPLWIDRTLKSRQQVPHTFFVHSFKKPTQCYHCKKLMKGMFRQGLKCKDCKIGVHKRCAKEIGNLCPGEVPSLSRVDSGEWTMATIARHVIANEYSIADDSSVHTMDSSDEVRLLPPKPEEQPVVEQLAVGGASPESGAVGGEGVREESPTSSSSSTEHFEPVDSYVGAPMDAIAEEPSGEDTTSNEGSEHNIAEHVDSADNIKLQRVTGVSMRHKKPPPASVLKEGWMVHYTNKSTMRKKHYWRLDTKCLTFYKSDNSSHYYKEISLADILAVDQMVNPDMYPLTPPHVFEIVTQQVTYYVGVDMTGALPVDLRPSQPVDSNSINLLGDVSHLTLPQLEDLGVGLNMGIMWEEALHSALMPVTPQASMGSLAEVGIGGGMGRVSSFRNHRGSLRGSLRGSFHGNRASSFRGGSIRGRKGSMRGSFRVPKERPGGVVIPTRGVAPVATVKQPKVETKMDISLFYQIFPEEILGSGQFGTVYGGQNRQTSKDVAVKVIDKLRFPHKHESQLRTEVTILQALSHPGIIFLEQMFETPEKIYVVMEKMNGDMLEMILNSPTSKLTERLTKFMTYQILNALQYLHKKDIVHCDLKPENVLLTAETGLPQAKLCDFGFARIIGEKSFRKSIVGTPAYLAPEVLKNEGYNRSLDLWSVGVIVYVSLSGTFPFNEDEEICDQIQNAAFMYPPDPWSSISSEAIDIINRLLQVSRKTRFKATQAVHHMWMRDVNLWEDLCALEGRLGMRYLTHESEDPFWTKHGAKQHPLAKREAELHSQNLSTQSTPEHRTSTPPTPHSNTSSPGTKRVVTFVDSSVTNGTPPTTRLTGDEKAGLGSALYHLSAHPDSQTDSGENGSMSSLNSDKEDSFTSSVEKGKYLKRRDEDVVKAEAHAERIGYKVSTV